mgnify:CR=1 FL=1
MAERTDTLEREKREVLEEQDSRTRVWMQSSRDQYSKELDSLDAQSREKDQMKIVNAKFRAEQAHLIARVRSGIANFKAIVRTLPLMPELIESRDTGNQTRCLQKCEGLIRDAAGVRAPAAELITKKRKEGKNTEP